LKYQQLGRAFLLHLPMAEGEREKQVDKIILLQGINLVIMNPLL
jgi:hypothetical protein